MKTRLTLILSVVLLWPNISLSNQEILDDEFKLDAISTGRKVFFETEKEPQLFFVNSETSSTPSFKLSYSSSYSHTVQGFYQSYQSKSSPLLIPRPDSYETVLNFAMMSSNAYVLQSVLREWRNMTGWDKVYLTFIDEIFNLKFFRKNRLDGMEQASVDIFLPIATSL